MQKPYTRWSVTAKLDQAYWSVYRALEEAAGAGGMESVEEDLSSMLLSLHALVETTSIRGTTTLRSTPQARSVA